MSSTLENLTVDPAERMRSLRAFYRDWRPTPLGKFVNQSTAWLSTHGLTPGILVTLEVKGSRSGRLRSNVLVVTRYNGEDYLVSMLGERSDWVRNVRAAGGEAFIRHGTAQPVVLVEVPAEDRAPILKAYCQVATSGRHHFPVANDAPLSEFEAIAARYPVFRITRSPAVANEDAPRAASETSPAQTIRALLVTIGPSLILDILVAASSVVAVRGFRRTPRAARLGRLVAISGALAPWLYLLRLRPWVLHWGATEEEVTAALPGDGIVADPGWQSTRAIEIAAPVETVWPWLAQMGQNRGGLYSLDWLENLAGFEFHNADRIVPEWQDVHVGDFVRFAPGQDTLTVAEVEPTRHLVWHILKPGTHKPGDLSDGSIAADATWAFVLRAIDDRHTRLIQRWRFGTRPRISAVLYTLIIEIPHFVMERQMLLGIRKRAERAYAP